MVSKVKVVFVKVIRHDSCPEISELQNTGRHFINKYANG